MFFQQQPLGAKLHPLRVVDLLLDVGPLSALVLNRRNFSAGSALDQVDFRDQIQFRRRKLHGPDRLHFLKVGVRLG